MQCRIFLHHNHMNHLQQATRLFLSALFMTVLTLWLPAQVIDLNKAYPVNCTNGKVALADSMGVHVTGCDYIDFYKHVPRHVSLQSQKDPSRVFHFGKQNEDTWVLLDSRAEEVPGVKITTQNIPPRFYVSSLHKEVNQIQVDELYYLYFRKTNILRGPFINSWQTPGCIQRGPNDVWGRYARYTQDTSLVLLDKQGNELDVMEGTSEYQNHSPYFYGVRSPEGRLEIRDTLGKVKFSGDYSFTAFRSSPYLTVIANEALTIDNKDRIKYAFVDSSGTLMMDTLYNTIYPFPTTTWKGQSSSSLHVAQVDGKYALLDTLLQEVLTSNAPIQIFPEYFFSMKDPNTSRINVYQGDTSKLILSDLLDYDQSSHHIIKTEEGTTLLDLTSLKPVSATYAHLEKTWIGSAAYRFITSDQQTGLLDSEGKEFLRLEVDTLSALMMEYYPHADLFKDSLITYREGDVYGIYDIINGRRLDLQSEEQIMVSNCKDIYIYTENGMKGFYHTVSGKKEPAIYKRIYVTRAFDHRNDVYADHEIRCFRADESTKIFFIYEEHCIEASKLSDIHSAYKPELSIDTHQGQQYLVDKRSRALILDKGFQRIDTVCDANKNIRYYKLTRQGKISYLNADKQKISPAESKWTKARALRNHPHLLLVTDGRGKANRGLYDLNHQAYVIPPQYHSLRNLHNGHNVLLCTKEGKALSTIDGEKLTDFSYKSIHATRNSHFFIARLKDNSMVILDKLGQIVRDEKYFSVNGISVFGTEQHKDYFQITEQNGDSLSLIIDAAGVVKMTLPSTYFYRALEGPLDLIFTSYDTRPYTGFLVKDFTLDPLSPLSNSMDILATRSVLKNEEYFYQVPTLESNLIYDHKGQLLVTLPPGQSLYINHRSLDLPYIHDYLITSDRNTRLSNYYKLDGEPFCTNCNSIRKNNYDTYEALCDGKKYFFN